MSEHHRPDPDDPHWAHRFEADLKQPWNPQLFNQERLPVVIGHAKHPIHANDIARTESALDMLVKLPGHTQLTLPSQYAQHPVITDLLTVMHRDAQQRAHCNPDERYAYLTVDARIVKAGKTHRNRGWHFDGMQGTRYQQALDVCYQYLWASTMPTEYSSTPVNATGLDPARDNWFTHLGRQVNDSDTTRHPAGTILLMSAYQLHRSPQAHTDTPRLLIRLDYSHKQQDRLGNSINDNLEAPFAYTPRSMPAGLSVPIDDTGWNHPDDTQER